MENKEDLLNINKNRNPKKLLIYSAAIFLIFVIGVIVFAIVQTKSSNESSEVIPPQVKEEPLFKEIPIQSPKEENTTKVKPSLNKEKQVSSTLPKQTITPVNKETKINNEKKENKIVTEVKEKPKVVKKVIKHPKKSVNGKYYVQVAALMKYKKPNKKFLALLKKYNYHYIIYPVVIRKNNKTIKINKLLIGPFKSKKEAEKELIRIRKFITQNAFIYKVKK